MKNNNKKNSKKSLSQLKKSPTKQSLQSILSKSHHSLKHSASKNQISIAKSRQALSNKLQTYSLLIRSKNPIRCLQHNSNISVYCQTEQKLLCANCIFGKNDHKFHKVVSIQRSYQKIQRDIETMNRLIDKEIVNMNKTLQKLMQILMGQEKDSQDYLIGLVKMYEECHRKLQQSFVRSKNMILDRIQNIRSSQQKKLYEIKLQLANYSSYNIIKLINKDNIKKDDYLVYEHVVCSAITCQKRFQQKDWLNPKGQIAKLAAEQTRKIKYITDEISRILFKQR